MQQQHEVICIDHWKHWLMIACRWCIDGKDQEADERSCAAVSGSHLSAPVKFDDWSPIFRSHVLLPSSHSFSSQDDISIALQMSDGSLPAGIYMCEGLFSFSSAAPHTAIIVFCPALPAALCFSITSALPSFTPPPSSSCMCSPGAQRYSTLKTEKVGAFYFEILSIFLL